MLKVLQISDTHIRDRDINELEKCLDYIVKVAQEEKPDICIHCGDVFDAAVRADSLSAKLAFRIFKELAEICPVVAILGTPSHDFTTSSILQYIKARFPVHVAMFPEQIYLCEGDIKANIENLEAPSRAPTEAVISMCPAPSKQFFKTDSDIKASDAEIASELSKLFLGFATQASEYDCPHVLVYHGTIRGAAISESQIIVGQDIEIGKDQVEMSGCDIALCGHLHYPQRLEPNIFYSGSITTLNYGEIHDHGFYIHEFEGKKLVNSRFMKTPSRKLIKISEDLTGAGTLADETGIPIMDMLIAAKPFKEVKDAIVRIEFKVYQDEAAKINKEELEQSIISSGAKAVDIRIIRIPRENVRSQKILKLTSLRDKLVEMAKLKQETVLPSILEKADLLESEESDKIIQKVAS